MFTYIITYRLESNQTYEARYNSLVNFIMKRKGFYDETTSTLFCATNEEISHFVKQMIVDVKFANNDNLLIIQLSTGAVTDAARIQNCTPQRDRDLVSFLFGV